MEYQISYISSEGDDYNIDGQEYPHLTVGVHKPMTPDNLVFPLTIYFPTDDSPDWAIKSHGSLSLEAIAKVISTIEVETMENGAEFYSSAFYDDETGSFDRVLTFDL